MHQIQGILWGACPVCNATIGITHMYMKKVLKYTDIQIHNEHSSSYKNVDSKKMSEWLKKGI